MSDAYESILNHLLFHKALISENDDGERINRYLAMLREIDQGMHVAVREPFEKAVAATFELALEKQLDPWDIDLGQFTRMYLEKMRDGGVVNFVTAGKLIFMAWSILKLQSDYVLETATPPAQEDNGSGDWDLDIYREPEDLDFNAAVLHAGRLPIAEAIRRQGRRAVTLMELMEAFDSARRESELQLQLNALREHALRKFAPNFHEKVHSEDLTEDIGLTWGRITQFGGIDVPLKKLVAARDRWDLVTVFVSLLFLAKMEKVKLWQKDFVSGDVFVRQTATRPGLTPDDLAGIPEISGRAVESNREPVAPEAVT